MKKLKKKIKQFLALWLKDELLDYLNYKDHGAMCFSPQERLVISYREIEKIQSVLTLGDRNCDLEYEIYHAKKRMSEEIMEKIEVETKELLSCDFSGCRRIYLTLYIAKNQGEI